MASIGLPKSEKGFALVVSMLILLVLTILVVNSVRNTALNEKMAGNYMDRTNALQAAEQALRQGEALLATNGDTCVSGCSVTGGSVAASTADGTPPDVWSDTGATTATITSAQRTSGKYQVKLLTDASLPSGKSGCKAYSIMGRGQGLDSRSVVVLQTIAFVCSI